MGALLHGKHDIPRSQVTDFPFEVCEGFYYSKIHVTEDAELEGEAARDEEPFVSSPKNQKKQDTRRRTSPQLLIVASSSTPVDEQKKRDVDEQEPMCPADSSSGSNCKKDLSRATIVPPIRLCLLLLH